MVLLIFIKCVSIFFRKPGSRLQVLDGQLLPVDSSRILSRRFRKVKMQKKDDKPVRIKPTKGYKDPDPNKALTTIIAEFLDKRSESSRNITKKN